MCASIDLNLRVRSRRATVIDAPLPSRLGRLFAPVDLASLAVFRIAFGLIMFWEVLRYFHYGWIDRYWVDPVVNFGYPGFEWVRAWPRSGMHLHFVVLGLLALCIAAGFFYRVIIPLFALGFTYIFFLDQTRYLNHFYLIILLSFLLCIVPAHKMWSPDARRHPELRADTTPAWTLWLLRAQIAVVYFFGGVAKLNGDWLRGEPMRMWLADRTEFPVIGRFFTEESTVYLFSYGALFIDLLAPALLLFGPTRVLMFGAVTLFHLLNYRLFTIGIFPWLMIAASLLFLPPEWPRRLFPRSRSQPITIRSKVHPHDRWIAAGLALYLALQVLIPLRHLAYPGNESWTEEGHRFAWHMKLRDKSTAARFFATDSNSDQTWELDPEDFAQDWQVAHIVDRPHMLVQLARHMRDVLRNQGYGHLEIRAEVMTSLNGRAPQLLVNPRVNLAGVRSGAPSAPWIVPLRDG